MLLTTSEILKQITRELATTGETPYPPEEELECVNTCVSNLMSVKLLMNFNAIWLSEDEQQQLVTDLQYQEFAEILAEEILDSCIADIAEELYGHDRVA